MKFKNVMLVSAMMSAIGAGSCFANELIDQTINNFVAAQQPDLPSAVGGQPQGLQQPTLPAQQGVQPPQQQPFVAQAGPSSDKGGVDSIVGVLADKTNPFTGEPVTVEDRKNMLSAVALDAQIIEKQLEVEKKRGELRMLPARIDAAIAEQSGAGGQAGQPTVNEQLIMQQQNNEAEIERRVQEGVRKAQLEKEFEIQTLKTKLQKKQAADAKMSLSSVVEAVGKKIAIIRVGDTEKKVMEGGVVSGWVVSRIDTDTRSVTLNQRGRYVTLDMKRAVSQIASSSKSSTATANGSYDNGNAPITPDLPNALPLPRL